MKVPILLPNIFNHPFTYESDINLKVGDYVMVPFGKSKITGVVWDEFEKKNNRNFKYSNFKIKFFIIIKRRLFLKKAIILAILPSFILKFYSIRIHTKNG